MNGISGTTLTVIVIAVIVIVLLLLIWAATRSRRRSRLRERFGPEYDRAVEETGSRGKAQAELEGRLKRREQLQVRELEPADRERFSSAWQHAQSHFVDEPSQAVREADGLVQEVMRARGYPVDDFDQRAADVSVDHPHVVDNYREAHSISRLNAENRASTEDLRRALVHYRELFNELLGTGRGADSGQAGAMPEERRPGVGAERQEGSGR